MLAATDRVPGHRVEIRAVLAAEPGGVDGYACVCECGLAWSTSLSLAWAVREAREHGAYWAARSDAEVPAVFDRSNRHAAADAARYSEAEVRATGTPRITFMVRADDPSDRAFLVYRARPADTAGLLWIGTDRPEDFQ